VSRGASPFWRRKDLLTEVQDLIIARLPFTNS
jgi:hypothetical protein